MKERPIIFSSEMVRAILEGRKTQTRRVIKPQPWSILEGWPYVDNPIEVVDHETKRVKTIYSDEKMNRFVKKAVCPYGQPGDRLWVRETCIYTPPCWADSENDYNIRDDKGGGRIITYLADQKPGAVENAKDYHLRVRPSIHMPRWASRITLEVVNVRVERVQEISGQDAIAEGVDWKTCPQEIDPRGAFLMVKGEAAMTRVDYRGGYAKLWDSINAKRGYSWLSNPWVWVIEFRRVAA